MNDEPIAIACQACGKKIATVAPEVSEDLVLKLNLECFPLSGTHRLTCDFLRIVTVDGTARPAQLPMPSGRLS